MSKLDKASQMILDKQATDSFIKSKEIRHRLTYPNMELRDHKCLSEYEYGELGHDLAQMNKEDLIEVCMDFWQTIQIVESQREQYQTHNDIINKLK